MYLARVLGAVVTPVQHPFFDRRTLLLVRRVAPDGRELGPDRVAVDAAQAGAGDLVLVLEEGNSARQVFDDPKAPVRSVVVGFVDEVEIDGSITLRNGEDSARPPRRRPRKKEGNSK
jgi:ethanolamine utilization protein EutN